ncbi:hypothetical protein ACFFLM_04990 [Deinococcus oregonensis]|uniref:Uncharacterized protein n=1 Tax=Deinococcus oregonensis TaxID=1805970 RepID=A0ABV6AV04_9DEIO
MALEERADLAQLESVVRQGWQGFVTVGEALLSIWDRRLYREAHETFGDYCEQVWGWSRQRAQHLMDAAETSHRLTTIDLTPRANARPVSTKGRPKWWRLLNPKCRLP